MKNEILQVAVVKDPYNGKTGDHSHLLMEGEKVVGLDQEISKVLSSEETQKICDETGCFYRNGFPVTITYLAEDQNSESNKLTAREARCQNFENLSEIKNFLLDNKGLLVHSITERVFGEKQFLLRYFKNVKFKNEDYFRFDNALLNFDINEILKIIEEKFGKSVKLDVNDKFVHCIKNNLVDLLENTL